ncbi:putative thymidylate synthase [Pseudomonas phage vB_PaeM_PAO1_Ab17]|uniref:Putative thymidylate synthase n=2 Tax=Nankokuvirus Ab03 TaxID=1925780 RepID=A0A0A1IWW9_9CAUD|nr:putative thymidylate synthase [Pseudomonas phage vB_PaeM_PAO1_Ab03]CEF89226.1 putative thymidylate synthase [Pseudomonas phage vB_PaeM_PAO1_Ab03]CEF89602.1 putative thymidylate synthase [Pseudomonas phage vB_PaeM_PAO1_Ab17]
MKASVIAKSISYPGTSPFPVTITTFELEYPRFIHAELMTHHALFKNCASSRAIPTKKLIEQVRNNPAMPVHWGANQAGMQAHKELSKPLQVAAKYLWIKAAKAAAGMALAMHKVGLHKQIVNRVLEPFQMMKTVVTATEWENFYWLRDHEDAQPEFQHLARMMKEATAKVAPELLVPGQWHVPYVKTEFIPGLGRQYYDENGNSISVEQALKLSASCCAQTSYRATDKSQDKAEVIFDKLINSEPVHASPTEHQATPMRPGGGWEKGVTHQDRAGFFWSSGLKGWIQHRQLIPNNCKKG